MEHLVLLGDSIFDNKSYVGSDPSVIEHLRTMIPLNWTATLCAVDGDTSLGIPNQLIGIPSNATYLFVSVGGNDALMNMNLLNEMTTPGPLLLAKLSALADDFRKNYSAAIIEICKLRKPTYICTIYNGNLETSIARAAKAAVSVFNDNIYFVANEKHLPVIDLRRICIDPTDYANPIEPSSKGAEKIARAIFQKVLQRRQYLEKSRIQE
jgi:lysophospholipase L1-like esterase